ncbi:MAG: flagellin [Planctomycetota bacterium]
MSGIINNNSSANTVYKNFSRNSAMQTSSMEKLATGLRINRASDDAAGLAISETLRREIKDTKVAGDNVANATNFINVADGYLQTVHDIYGRMSELAVRAGDGTLSPIDQAHVKTEYDALNSEITNLATNGKFNGLQVFDGNARQFTVDSTGATFSISAGSMAVITAPGVMGAGSDGTAELALVTAAVGAVATQRASLGAEQSQLNFKTTGLENYAENAGAYESRIRDVDVAKESTNLSKSQILVQASTAMLTQANQSSQGVLALLKQ